MDSNTLTTAGLTATFTAMAGILYKIYMVVNKKRCRSRCCGYDMESSLDIGSITPPIQNEITVPTENFINNPLHKTDG